MPGDWLHIGAVLLGLCAVMFVILVLADKRNR
jgi:hypothetical protein